jgi:uncharacterized protein (TIGR03067 family)
MRHVVLIMATAALLARGEALPRGGARPDQAVASKLTRMQGRWEGISYESRDGKNEDAHPQLKIERDVFTLAIGHSIVAGRVVLNPTARPRACDLRFRQGAKQVVCRCIYDVEGDRLRLCFGPDPMKQPSAFPAGAGGKERFGLFVFKRAKAQP